MPTDLNAKPIDNGADGAVRPLWEPTIAEDASPLEYALAYAEAGWYVAPAAEDSNGELRPLNIAMKTRDPQQLATWFGAGGHRHMALIDVAGETYLARDLMFRPGPSTAEFIAVLNLAAYMSEESVPRGDI